LDELERYSGYQQIIRFFRRLCDEVVYGQADQHVHFQYILLHPQIAQYAIEPHPNERQIFWDEIKRLLSPELDKVQVQSLERIVDCVNAPPRVTIPGPPPSPPSPPIVNESNPSYSQQGKGKQVDPSESARLDSGDPQIPVEPGLDPTPIVPLLQQLSLAHPQYTGAAAGDQPTARSMTTNQSPPAGWYHPMFAQQVGISTYMSQAYGNYRPPPTQYSNMPAYTPQAYGNHGPPGQYSDVTAYMPQSHGGGNPTAVVHGTLSDENYGPPDQYSNMPAYMPQAHGNYGPPPSQHSDMTAYMPLTYGGGYPTIAHYTRSANPQSQNVLTTEPNEPQPAEPEQPVIVDGSRNSRDPAPPPPSQPLIVDGSKYSGGRSRDKKGSSGSKHKGKG
jgi:hypothetical protein